MSEAEPRIISEQELYRGFLHIVQRQVAHPGGGQQTYEIVNPDSASASVVAFDTEGQVILVELYRFAQNRRLIELPAGKVEAGEAPIKAIRRELAEETGYRGELQAVGEYFIAAEHGVRRHIFVATNCQYTAPPTREPSEVDEGMRVVKRTLAEFRALLRSGQMTEVAGGYMALDHLNLL